MLAFQLVRGHCTHLDVIAARLQILDQFRAPLAIAERGVEDQVLLAFDSDLQQFIGPLAGIGVGVARPGVGVGIAQGGHFGVSVTQFIRIDQDDIPA